MSYQMLKCKNLSSNNCQHLSGLFFIPSYISKSCLFHKVKLRPDEIPWQKNRTSPNWSLKWINRNLTEDIGCRLVLGLVQYFCSPVDSSLPGSSVHGIPSQEHWCGLPFPPPGDLSDSGKKPTSLVSPALAGGFFTTESPGKLPWEYAPILIQ